MDEDSKYVLSTRQLGEDGRGKFSVWRSLYLKGEKNCLYALGASGKDRGTGALPPVGLGTLRLGLPLGLSFLLCDLE